MKNKYSIGIGLNLFDARAILLRDDRKVIIEIEKKREHVNANETIAVLLDLFEGIVSKAKQYKECIEGVGLALGGIVDNTKGVVHWPQKHNSSYTYISVPLKTYLEKKFGFPVTLENDANGCAWAEYTSHFPKSRNLVYMFSGVGCGIVVDGHLYRGKNGGAGELFINQQKMMSSSLGEFKFLRQWPVDLGMVKRAKELISRGRVSSLIKKITSTGDLALADIFAEGAKKDKLSREVLKEAAFSLGVKIAFLTNLLNPEVVVIGGGLEAAGEVFLDECSDTVKSFAFSEMRSNLKIVASQTGKNATSLGAAAIIFREKSLQE
ncbi:MAG: ROK family protein [Candidatus Omnitrophota bacterium]|nr:ROK family protein [Candidatus Omnitrophota bacterium]